MSRSVFLSLLDNIPDSKLQNIPPRNGPVRLYDQPRSEGSNYRLDKQGTTKDGYHNIQTQANKQAKCTSIRKLEAPNTVAAVLVLDGCDPPITPDEVWVALRISYRERRVVRLPDLGGDFGEDY